MIPHSWRVLWSARALYSIFGGFQHCVSTIPRLSDKQTENMATMTCASMHSLISIKHSTPCVYLKRALPLPSFAPLRARERSLRVCRHERSRFSFATGLVVVAGVWAADGVSDCSERWRQKAPLKTTPAPRALPRTLQSIKNEKLLIPPPFAFYMYICVSVLSHKSIDVCVCQWERGKNRGGKFIIEL